MSHLDSFLKLTVEKYLFGDLQSMRTGTVGYPMVMSAFAGIELLGGLLSPTKFNPHKGREYFESFWSNWLYPNDAARATAAVPLYKLVRHGLMHVYAVKADIVVVRGQPDWHLTRGAGGAIWVDAWQLADDFQACYFREVRRLVDEVPVSPRRIAMANRLDDMNEEYERETCIHLQNVRLPAQGLAGAAGPSGASNGSSTTAEDEGPSGAAFPL